MHRQSQTPITLHDTHANSDNAGRRLDSWKEIAAYLNRSPRCVQRWEKHLELPVHRIQHAEGYTVYAYVSELDAWRQSREPARAKAEPSATQACPNRHGNCIRPAASPRWRTSMLSLRRLFGKVVPLRLARS